MSESVLKSVLEESAQLEWDKYNNSPVHSFSKKHNRSMKRIYKQYEYTRCSGISNNNHRIRITRKTALILLLIVFLAAVAGCAAAFFWSQSFRGIVHSDNTELFVINTENCPSNIEDKYCLSALSEEYEMLDIDSTPFYEYSCYQNKITEQIISFRQYVKSNFKMHYNTEVQDLEEIEINRHYGLCLDFSSNGLVFADVIWDNGDYILEISGDLDKNTLLDLAKSAKVYKE